MSLRILIGDNDKNTRSTISQIINSSFKCKITEIEEVREFITAAISQSFDLAILDLDIQPQNNEQIISVIRSVHSNEKLPIIVVASMLDKERIIGLLRLGIADIILKPVYENSASDKLKNLLRIISAKKNDDKDEAEPEVLEEASSDTSGKGKFLLVDGDRTFRSQFMRLFGEKYEIIIADNGQEGLNLFEKIRPEYVFVSEHIKLINERALVQKIRAIPWGAETKVYFFSTILKSTAMKSNLFNGVVEKSASMETFNKEFRKVVLGEETSLFQKTGKVLRTELGPQLPSIATGEFLRAVGMEVTIISNNSNLVIANETLASVELIDEKQEISVTIGLFGTSKDMLFIAEKLTGAPTPFNSKAIEAIGGVITAMSQRVNHIIALSGISLMPQPSKVTSRLENKLKYDWDIEVSVKGPANEHYKVAAYCSKFV